MTVTERAAPTDDLDIPTFDDVMRARERLAGVAHRTPVLTSRFADERTGARLFFKCENLQRAGAFKFRGAANAHRVAVRGRTPARRRRLLVG